MEGEIKGASLRNFLRVSIPVPHTEATCCAIGTRLSRTMPKLFTAAAGDVEVSNSGAQYRYDQELMLTLMTMSSVLSGFIFQGLTLIHCTIKRRIDWALVWNYPDVTAIVCHLRNCTPSSPSGQGWLSSVEDRY